MVGNVIAEKFLLRWIIVVLVVVLSCNGYALFSGLLRA